MRYTKYSKWTGQSWDDISLEELMEALSDYLLRSGFEDQFRRHYRRWSQDWGYDEFDDLDPDDALERLRRGAPAAPRGFRPLRQGQKQPPFPEKGKARAQRPGEIIDPPRHPVLQQDA